MKLPMSPSELLVLAIVIAGIGIVARQFVGGGDDGAAVRVPALSSTAQAGEAAFDANCASCHGRRGAGTHQGPPLVHDIYNPGHHPDAAFQAAVRNGARSHHWSFGDMPAQPQVSEEQVREIVRYVRELQRANGIVPREHRM
jgi:mono/diheme cytochrome c family protein